MIPRTGKIVDYTLSEQDAKYVNNQRDSSKSLGVLAHIGNTVKPGEVYPMVITRIWGGTAESSVNGQVLLDGSDLLWVTSVSQGDGERHWRESVDVVQA